MERLTEEKQIGPFAALKDKAEAVPGAFGSYDCLYAHMVAVTRLKEYEDTGIEPEEVKEHEAAYIEIMTRTYGPIHEKIGQWLQAEKDGRLVVLPCKIMDTIFMAVGRYGITGFEEDRCDGFFINREGILQIKAQCYSGNHATYGFPGETVFLTREEAEAALEGTTA